PRTPLAFLTTTMRRAPRSTLFPYTTLFRSGRARRPAPRGGVRLHQGVVRRQVRRRPYRSDRQEGPARSMSTDVLRIENLNKVFETPEGPVHAVRDVSVEVRGDEFFSLLGPSGCGKTTTLRMIAGLETVTSGTIRFKGRDLTRLPSAERNLGMVFQSYALFPHMTVF